MTLPKNIFMLNGIEILNLYSWLVQSKKPSMLSLFCIVNLHNVIWRNSTTSITFKMFHLNTSKSLQGPCDIRPNKTLRRNNVHFLYRCNETAGWITGSCFYCKQQETKTAAATTDILKQNDCIWIDLLCIFCSTSTFILESICDVFRRSVRLKTYLVIYLITRHKLN